MEVKACNCGGGVEVQLPGHAVQVGQLEVNTAHRQHTGLKEVDITVVITGNLKETEKTCKKKKRFVVKLSALVTWCDVHESLLVSDSLECVHSAF